MRKQCWCHNNNICIMQTNGTINPYHQIVKSKVHQKQPFLKQFAIMYRGNGRKGKRTHLNSVTNKPPNIETISNCKRSLNYWNSQNRYDRPNFGFPAIRAICTITQIFGIPIIQYNWNSFNFVNSKNSHNFQSIRFVYFQEYFIFCNLPIFGIPDIRTI